MVKSAIEAQKFTEFDRAHFLSFGAYSLDFETVYYVLSADYINTWIYSRISTCSYLLNLKNTN
jgi:hypothetical protein